MIDDIYKYREKTKLAIMVSIKGDLSVYAFAFVKGVYEKSVIIFGLSCHNEFMTSMKTRDIRGSGGLAPVYD